MDDDGRVSRAFEDDGRRSTTIDDDHDDRRRQRRTTHGDNDGARRTTTTTTTTTRVDDVCEYDRGLHVHQDALGQPLDAHLQLVLGLHLRSLTVLLSSSRCTSTNSQEVYLILTFCCMIFHFNYA